MKRSSLGLIAFAGILSLGAGNARAATLTVTTLRDSGRGSLRQVIERANRTTSADTIVFAPRLRGTLGLMSSLPILSSPVSIIGPGRDRLNVRRTGKARYRIFTVAKEGNVLLSGLTLSNGFSPVTTKYYQRTAGGGGVRNEGVLVLKDCAVTGNRAGSNGGGILNTGHQLTLMNCLVSDNQCLLTNPEFDGGPDFQAASGGGGLYNRQDNVELLIADCTFSNNVCHNDGDGGAIKNASGAEIRIRRSTLTQNTASRGGALDSLVDSDGGGGSFDVSESLISNNKADVGGAFCTAPYGGTATFTNCTLGGNRAKEGGGAISSGYGGVKLYNCTITGNISPKCAGVRTSVYSSISGCIIAGNLLPSHTPGIDFDFWGPSQSRSRSKPASKLDPSQGGNLIGRGDAKTLAFFHGTGDRRNVSPAGLRLGPLADNGGPTKTYALLSGSPAIGKGENYSADDDSSIDQRGVLRSQGRDGNGDIGAFQTTKVAAKTKK